MWPRGKTIDDATIIGEQDGGMYKRKGITRKILGSRIYGTNQIIELHIYTIENHQLQAKQYQVYLRCKQNMKAFAKDVRKG